MPAPDTTQGSDQEVAKDGGLSRADIVGPDIG